MRNPLIIFVTVSTLMLASCGSGNKTIPTGVSTNPTTETWQCGLVQESIDDLDISGTWRAEYNAYSTETLFINQNEFYSQRYESGDYQYESESNRWYLEELPGGGIYVHFEGMLDCESLDRCVNPSNNELEFYDFCGDRWFSFEHEFVLSLVGDSRYSRGFWLRRMRPAGCEGCFVEYYSVEK